MSSKKYLNDYEATISLLHQHLHAHNRFPHEGQFPFIKAHFSGTKKIIQAQCGRSAGKTESDLYIAWREAATKPGSEIYIILPEIDQAKRVYWTSNRLQGYGPRQLLLGEPQKSDLLIRFQNGSYIALGGAKNYESLRGIKPNLVFGDEFQGHCKEFYTEVMEPNLAGKNCKFIITGTPPKEDCFYVEFWHEHQEAIRAGDTSRFYIELPTWVNPTQDYDWLMKKKAELIRNGDEKVWLREYEGKLIFGGQDAVFPRWDEKKHVHSHDVILKSLEYDKNKLRWATAFDPGTDSCFAVLFCCYNPYTAQFFILDEIYETERKQTEPLSMWDRAREIQKRLYDGNWINIYDNREAWFAQLIQKNRNFNLIPCDKHSRKIDVDVGIMKEMMAGENCLFVSDKCKNFAYEVVNFITDDKGKYSKKRDHLLDDWRYILRYLNYRFIEKVKEPLLYLKDSYSQFGVRHHKIEKLGPNDDWTESIVDNSLISEPWEWKD